MTLRQARWGAVLATIALGACGTPPAASRALPAVPADEPSAVMPWADSPEPEFVTATLPDHDGAPLLLLAPSDRPGTRYMGELLRTEGFTTFDVAEIATPDVLAAARIIIAGVDAVRDDAAGPLRSAVERGADLLLVRPTGALAELAGLEVAGERQGGVLIRAGRFPLQVHGPVATYRAVDAEVRAEVRAELEGEPVGPGVTVRRLAAGGRVIALSFDPVQSVVQARQGNPAWANTSRDGFRRFRSTDLFFGGVDRPAGAGTERDPDHVLWPLAVTPQADEHLRLLRELIVDEQGALPLPRIDYLPRGRRAAVLMTGDDHGSGGTAGRFARFGGLSPPGCRAERWECVRGSSYVDPSVRLDPASVSSWLEEEFEIGLHVAFDEPLDGATYADVSATQGAALAAAMPELPPASSRRNHGAATSGYAIQAKVLSQGSTRLDVNGYYWPPSWVASRPPYANGTLLPMRFADVDGTTIDAFGLPTVWTDESGQAFPDVADTMMDAALDPDGWPGIFTSNFHTDMAESPIAEAVIASAQDRGVAVISGRQLMQWWEAREAVVISNVSWDGARLEFDVLPHDAAGARLELPARLGGRAIQLQRRGQPAPAVDLRVERGREVASVEATPDRWTASWGPSERPPLEAKPACTAWSGLPSTLLELRGLRRRPDGALLTVPLSLGHPGAAEDMAGGAFGRGGASRAAGGGLFFFCQSDSHVTAAFAITIIAAVATTTRDGDNTDSGNHNHMHNRGSTAFERTTAVNTYGSNEEETR